MATAEVSTPAVDSRSGRATASSGILQISACAQHQFPSSVLSRRAMEMTVVNCKKTWVATCACSSDANWCSSFTVCQSRADGSSRGSTSPPPFKMQACRACLYLCRPSCWPAAPSGCPSLSPPCTVDLALVLEYLHLFEGPLLHLCFLGIKRLLSNLGAALAGESRSSAL